MGKIRANSRRIGSIVLALMCIAVAGGAGWSIFGKKAESLARTTQTGSDEVTGSLGQGARTLGPSGLPIPRFVSLKAEKVNVRKGPSSDHPVAWVFQRKGMPVEIVAEFDNWRRIRDSDGEEGWILQNMLAGKRTAVIAPWRLGENLPLHRDAASQSPLVAELGAGVVGEIHSCTGAWCEIETNGYDGWIEQSMLWGVYPGEQVD